jgi:hypothetical protein
MSLLRPPRCPLLFQEETDEYGEPRWNDSDTMDKSKPHKLIVQIIQKSDTTGSHGGEYEV